MWRVQGLIRARDLRGTRDVMKLNKDIQYAGTGKATLCCVWQSATSQVGITQA